MPAEIVIVRHGQCTGNVADRASFKGNHNLFTEEIRGQKSSLWPLTAKGITESELAGRWIRGNITTEFDYYFTSDYVRATQTARSLGFGKSAWVEDALLRERAWGGVENLPYPERHSLFEKIGYSVSEDSISWKPPNGESMLVILDRVSSFLRMISQVAQGKKVLVISHGAPIQAIRVLQHGITQNEYLSFIGGNNYLRNCHIFHYTSKKDGVDGIPLYSFERSVYLNPSMEWIDSIQKI